MIYTNAVAAPRQELSDVVMEAAGSTEEFIGTKVFPPYPLTLPSGHYPKITIGTGNLARAAKTVRRPGATFDRWQSAIEDGSVNLLQVAEEAQIPDETSMRWDSYFDVESVYSIEQGNRLLRGIEIESAAALMNASTFDANNSLVAYTAANKATMNFPDDVYNALRVVKNRGGRANTIIIPGLVYDRIKTSTLLKDFLVGNLAPGRLVTEENIREAFGAKGIENVWIADGIVNESQDSKTNSINPIWPSTYIWVGRVASGELRNGGIGRTFFWEKEGPLLNISTYRDEPHKSNIVRGIRTSLAGIVNSRDGTLITTQYA